MTSEADVINVLGDDTASVVAQMLNCRINEIPVDFLKEYLEWRLMYSRIGGGAFSPQTLVAIARKANVGVKITKENSEPEAFTENIDNYDQSNESLSEPVEEISDKKDVEDDNVHDDVHDDVEDDVHEEYLQDIEAIPIVPVGDTLLESGTRVLCKWMGRQIMGTVVEHIPNSDSITVKLDNEKVREVAIEAVSILSEE